MELNAAHTTNHTSPESHTEHSKQCSVLHVASHKLFSEFQTSATGVSPFRFYIAVNNSSFVVTGTPIDWWKRCHSEITILFSLLDLQRFTLRTIHALGQSFVFPNHNRV